MSHLGSRDAADAAANPSRLNTGVPKLTSEGQSFQVMKPDSGFVWYPTRDGDDFRGPPPGRREVAAAALLDGDGGQEVERMSMVRRKKNFKCMEKVDGKLVNVLQGLELHTRVFNAEEQRAIVDCINDLQEKGRQGLLRERTYSEPRKWMRGKGRVTIQFGCCYNYAVDKHGNPPGIIRDEYVDPIPPLLKAMIKRMVAWRVLPPSCVPNSCIVNIYDKDDCIPPHIDHHDFLRPFCTVSFLSECAILFGAELKVFGPGEFLGPSAISLPLGSVLILNGNGANVAKHCVPAVPSKRISITFRKMDESKMPYKFVPDLDMQNLQPLTIPLATPSSSVVPAQDEGSGAGVVQQGNHVPPDSDDEDTCYPYAAAEDGGVEAWLPQVVDRFAPEGAQSSTKVEKKPSAVPQLSGNLFRLQLEDFPPLGSAGHSKKRQSRPPRQ